MRDKNDSGAIIGYIINGLVTFSGGFFIYEVITNSDWTFAPEWNMFKSVLLIPLYIIGLIVVIANWNKFSFSQDYYIKTTYSDGTTKTEKSYDIMDFMIGHIILPLLGRFFLAPMIIAAFIYYPLMCVVWLVGSIFPYVLSVVVLGIVGVSWGANHIIQFKNSSVVLSLVGLMLIVGFSYGGYAIEKSMPASFVQPSEKSVAPVAVDSADEDTEMEEINEDEFE
ncbi:MAG: hypothetical protein IJ804_05470 [Prevotella sp.]|nr:hypothetical protein [Prevotella sp.]